MNLVGYERLMNSDNRIRNEFLTQKPQEMPSDRIHDAESQTPSKDAEATLEFSGERRSSGNVLMAGSVPGNDFSTDDSRNHDTAQNTVDGSVLNHYRYFVQGAQYAGSEGSVRRIFN